MTRRTLSDVEKQEIKIMYETTSLANLSSRFGISTHQVKDTLIEMGVSLRGRGRIRKVGVDRDDNIRLVEETVEDVAEPLFEEEEVLDDDDENEFRGNYFGE